MKPLHLSIIIAATLIAGSLMLTLNKPGAQNGPPADNVTIENGQQIVTITAKGGYLPRTSTAKAGIPTVIRFRTEGTFDCSTFIRIPSMGVSQYLPSTGTVDIPVTNPKAGLLNGMCGMGMYPFQVNFEN